eukprot:TRINITY_DN18151_c0_g1_i1.p1 TRINITY_DN18151_c0_g1~~TRINITY_DN18151_c0_g1_i1.p1  ORF type:complete len:352 (-),score=45.65 TRINITY_DN18151_c0_g1_i1:63-1118(-)
MDYILVLISLSLVLLFFFFGTGFVTAKRSTQQQDTERQIHFSFLSGRVQCLKSSQDGTAAVRILDSSNLPVVPLGRLETVFLGPLGPVKPLSAYYNTGNTLLISFTASVDGDYEHLLYYDGVLVNEVRSYPFHGFGDREPPTPKKNDEIDDQPFRVPVPTRPPEKVKIPKELSTFTDPTDPTSLSTDDSFSTDDCSPYSSTDENEIQDKQQKKSHHKKRKIQNVLRDSVLHEKAILEAQIDYPLWELPVHQDTFITVRLKNSSLNKLVDEPNIIIHADIKCPHKKRQKFEAEKAGEIGNYKLRFHPMVPGKYKARVSINDNPQKWRAKLYVGVPAKARPLQYNTVNIAVHR